MDCQYHWRWRAFVLGEDGEEDGGEDRDDGDDDEAYMMTPVNALFLRVGPFS